MRMHGIFEHDVVGLEVVVVHRCAVCVVERDHDVSQNRADERLVEEKR